jgi:hypothetical protein
VDDTVPNAKNWSACNDSYRGGKYLSGCGIMVKTIGLPGAIDDCIAMCVSHFHVRRDADSLNLAPEENVCAL